MVKNQHLTCADTRMWSIRSDVTGRHQTHVASISARLHDTTCSPW
jgi:hypothetical protein